jgi:hypothetical protein
MRTIIIEIDGPHGLNVREGDCHAGGLSWGEMLEQVVALTHPKITTPPRYAMRTEAEWIVQYPHWAEKS